MKNFNEKEADFLRKRHRELLKHLGYENQDNKLSYGDALWLMMRAAEGVEDIPQ